MFVCNFNLRFILSFQSKTKSFNMRRFAFAVIAVSSSLLISAQTKTLSGFSDNNAKQEFAIEEKFDSYL